MASVVDRVNKLLALATSANMHEARNAALLAAKLIREHGLEVRERSTEPPQAGRREHPTPAGRRATPKPRRPSSKKNAQVPPVIESPLGGECVVCGRRYRAGTDIHWSDAEGGIHTACVEEWMKRR